MANTQSYVPMVGVDMLHYAKVKTDNTAYATETPVAVPGATEIGFNQNGSISTFYADNVPYDVAASPGEMDVSIACADVTPQMRADLFGEKYDTTTGLVSGGEMDSPYVAVAYRIQKSNGAYRYVRIFKMKSVPNEQKAQTKGGSINFQTNGFTAKAAARAMDDKVYQTLDSDDPHLPTKVTAATIESKWFTDFTWVPSNT